MPVLLLVAIGLESYSFRTAIVESNRVRGDASWVDFVRRAKAPELPVVLLEDLGALVGLVLALFGVSLTLLTGDGTWDGLGTVAIGVLLVVIAVILAVETKSLLLGEAAQPAALRRITDALLADPSVERVIHMRTLHLGPDELLVAAKIAVPPRMNRPCASNANRASLTSRDSTRQPRYSGVRPTIMPARKTATTMNRNMLIMPTPTPPKITFSHMAARGTRPVSGLRLSCMEFTEPFEEADWGRLRRRNGGHRQLSSLGWKS